MNTSLKTPVALIADDDEITRAFMEAALEQAGCTTVCVGDGASALQAVLAQSFDIVLLDVNMPKMDGYVVCRAIRALPTLQFLPVVMVTSKADPASIGVAFDAGATDFIAKPVQWSLVPHRMRYILRNAEIEKQSRFLAYHDALTELPNAQGLDPLIASAIERAVKTPGEGVALLKLEVGGVSRIRAVFGPEAGDEALLGFSQAVLAYLRTFDPVGDCTTLARVEGDAFVLCLRATEIPATAKLLADDLITDLETPVNCGERQYSLAPTIGIALYPEHGLDGKALKIHAATATHHALDTVSKLAVTYTPEIGAKAIESMALGAALREVVEQEQLTLYYQPKFNIAEGSFIGVEALLRWFDPSLGEVSPGRFIPIAEESGLILDIGRWVIKAACQQIAAWREAGLETKVAVNVSGKQFLHDNPVQYIVQTAQEFDVPPSSLIIEITESALITNMKEVQAGLRDLRSRGYRIAMDDFGTGYSSLSYLKNLPVDELKLDRSFIRNVDKEKIDATICAAVLGLARELGLSVTAEGIETQGQFDWLKARGCDEAQGFLLARPAAASEILKRYGVEIIQV
jgi:diguanylate cyclase